MLMNDLTLLQDLFGNSEYTKLMICTVIFVWCSLRQRNGGLNSGPKSANIVTDAEKWRRSKTFKRVTLALSLKSSTANQIWYTKGYGSGFAIQGSWVWAPLWARIFHFVIRGSRSSHLEFLHTNEINHDIHLANTLFLIMVRLKKYGCRCQGYITVYVSVNTTSNECRNLSDWRG